MAYNPYVEAARKYWERKSRRDPTWKWGGPTEDKDEITPEEDKELVTRDLEAVQAAINRERRQKAMEKESLRVAAEQRARQEEAEANQPSFMDRLGNAFTDFFDANTEDDKKRRAAQGLPEDYEEAKKVQKERADLFKKDSAEPFERGKQLNFAKDEIEARRDFYKRNGIDIDQLIKDKQVYEQFMSNMTSRRDQAQAFLKGEIPEEAMRFEEQQERAREIEQNYQQMSTAEAGADNIFEQAERSFVRGMGEPFVTLPANAQAYTAALMDVLSPEGSRVDKFAEEQYQAGVTGRDNVAQQIIDTGYGAYSTDNQFVSNLASSAGSLGASAAAAGMGGTGAAGALFGVSTGGEQLVESKKAGRSDLEALITGTGAGLVEGLLEKFGLDTFRLDTFIGAGGNIATKTFTRMVTEASQEAAQSLAQSGIELGYKDVDMAQAVAQAFEEGGYGAVIGGGAGLSLSIAEDLEAKGVPPAEAQQAADAAVNKMQEAADTVKIEPKQKATEGEKREKGRMKLGKKAEVKPEEVEKPKPEVKTGVKPKPEGKKSKVDDDPDYFKTDTTGIPEQAEIIKNEKKIPMTDGEVDLREYHRRAKGVDYKVVEMTPDEYLEREKKVKGHDGQIPISQENVNKYAEQMKAGEKFDILYLNERTEGQEGRHRALAAKQAGAKRVRVLVGEKYEPKAKPAPEKPKGAMKPLGKAKAKLVYPKSEELPAEQKDKLSKESYVLDMETTRGNRIAVKKGQDAGLTIINTAIKEAKKNKEADKLSQFTTLKEQHLERKQWSDEDAMDVAEYLTGKREKIKVQESEKLQESSKVTPTQLRDAGVDFRRNDIQALVKEVPQLKDNPQMEVRVKDGEYSLAYKGKGQGAAEFDFSIRASKLGVSNARMEAAGLKQGDVIDISDALRSKGRLPAINKGGVNYDLAPAPTETKATKREKYARSKTPEDLKRLIDNLNKAGQKSAITRRGQLRSKKAAGMFTHFPKSNKKRQGDEAIKLQDAVIKDPAQYVSVLAHELAHAIEWQVTGFTGKKTYEMLGAKTPKEKAALKKELKDIVDNIESKAVVDSKPGYYYSATEMWARYIETWLLENTSARELAPNVTKSFEQLIVTESAVRDLFDALEDNMDKGWRNYTPEIFKDRRQLYRKQLGKAAGDVAYEAEVTRRANVQRSADMIERLVKKKFKDVKDSGEALFKAAEAIKIVDGQIDYGTTDTRDVAPDDKAAIKKFTDLGYEPSHKTIRQDGKEVIVLSKVRYTPEQAKRLLGALSPEGRKLIEDFNAAKEDAKDIFNRQLIRDIYGIEANIEGWVHRGLREKKGGRLKPSGRETVLQQRKASLAKKRSAEEGHLKDFRKQMTKALIEAETARINNAFIQRQLARISKPIAKGEPAEDGWTEVIYDKKYGMRLPGESRESMTIQQVLMPEEGFFGAPEILGTKKFVKPVQRYQIPTELAEHYRNIRQIPQEMNRVSRTLNLLGKYWTINVLTHPGTTATNAISGGLQYAAKVFNDFYLETLTGKVTYKQTRSDLIAPIVALTPRGWSKAPSWLWGGFRSSLVGQVASEKDAEAKIDKYGDTALKVFGEVENFWKRAIALSEGSNFSNEVADRKVRELTRQEERLVAMLNKPIDLYAYDYDNKPFWIDKMDRKGGKLVKPFLTYPYKYTKMIMNLGSGAFDRSLPWQERAAKILTLGTLIGAINALLADAEDETETPEGTEKTPYQLKPGGRVRVGKDEKGREVFVRTAKYPFFNLTSLGRSVLKGHYDESTDIMREQFGSTGLGLDIGLLAIGRKSEFDQYKPTEAVIGEELATLLPGFRILNDIGRMIDPNSRSQETFAEGFVSNLPIWGDEETLRRWRGKKRTIKIPDEPEEPRSISESSTTERDVTVEPSDILRSLFTGIYVSRIDPEEAKKQQRRELRNEAEKVIRDLLREGKESEAQDKARQAGFILPEGTLSYYRRQKQ